MKHSTTAEWYVYIKIISARAITAYIKSLTHIYNSFTNKNSFGWINFFFFFFLLFSSSSAFRFLHLHYIQKQNILFTINSIHKSFNSMSSGRIYICVYIYIYEKRETHTKKTCFDPSHTFIRVSNRKHK